MKKINYQTPEVLVTDLNLEGMLCQSGPDVSAASIEEWVEEDFNPSGTRVGFLTDTGFISAKWDNDQDFYCTVSEEGDDYKLAQILPDGTRQTWCKYENGEAVEGYLPNMPTHFMLIPKTPDGFSWPYNTEKK